VCEQIAFHLRDQRRIELDPSHRAVVHPTEPRAERWEQRDAQACWVAEEEEPDEIVEEHRSHDRHAQAVIVGPRDQGDDVLVVHFDRRRAGRCLFFVFAW
jgi:hypothetical protein